MTFARVVFLLAGLWGLLVLTPMYFMFEAHGRDTPPAITHPEFYYGFIGVALAWQVAFLLIAADPLRFRPLMLVGVIEKASYAVAVAILFAQGALAGDPAALGGVVDLVLGLLFLAAYFVTRPVSAAAHPHPPRRQPAPL